MRKFPENPCQEVNIDTWHRRNNFEFFKEFLNPNVGVTVMVDASRAYERAKREGTSFFLRYFHAVLRATNAIDEMHYRIGRDGRVFRYDRIDGLAPIGLKGTDRFAELRFLYDDDFARFAAVAEETMKLAATTDPYSSENSFSGYDMILVSAVPDIAFTSIAGTLRSSQGNDYPIVNVGKKEPDGKMPVAINIHHGLVDGVHVARFFSLIQKYLDE